MSFPFLYRSVPYLSFVSCHVQSRCVLYYPVLSCPVLLCPDQSYLVLSCPVLSGHVALRPVAELAFRSNKHTYTPVPQFNSNHNILSVSSTNELKIDQERYPNFVNAGEATFNILSIRPATSSHKQPQRNQHGLDHPFILQHDEIISK